MVTENRPQPITLPFDHRIEAAINARRIIKPPVFIASNGENVVGSSSAFS
jgi:hypothetical protein